MDFCISDEAEQARAEMRRFLGRYLSPEIRETVHHTGTVHDWTFHRALAAEGWLAAPWPVEAGGRGLGPLEMLDVLEEMTLAGAPVDGWVVTMNVASTLRSLASPDLCATVLPPVLVGEALICLGLTEPDAGSDVAAVVTRAERDGDEWVINGQKMFTTLAHEARWVLLLTRTDPTVAKHRGLTMFLVPLASPGIELQPIHTLGGERTNVTFYVDVRVEDRWRVGEVNEGWSVLMTALALERGGEFGGTALFTGALGRMLGLASQEAAGDASATARLGRVAANLHAARLLARKSAWVSNGGRPPVVEAAMAKLYAAESLQRAATSLLDLLGCRGLLPHGAPGAPADGWLEHAYRQTAVTTIYGGTSEMMRTIVAGQGLGLPR